MSTKTLNLQDRLLEMHRVRKEYNTALSKWGAAQSSFYKEVKAELERNPNTDDIILKNLQASDLNTFKKNLIKILQSLDESNLGL